MHPNSGRVVSNFIVHAIQNNPITLDGEDTQTRSFCYVDDLIDGFVRLMDSPEDDLVGPMNLGNPGEFTMIELAEAALEQARWPQGFRCQRCAAAAADTGTVYRIVPRGAAPAWS
jgi:nucleoside-diphosphate-sugar epimerase